MDNGNSRNWNWTVGYSAGCLTAVLIMEVFNLYQTPTPLPPSKYAGYSQTITAKKAPAPKRCVILNKELEELAEEEFESEKYLSELEIEIDESKRIEELNRNVEKLHGELTYDEARPSRSNGYIPQVVKALQSGSVAEKKRKLYDVIIQYVCSACSDTRTLVLDENIDSFVEGLSDVNPGFSARSLLMTYKDPLVPLGKLFELMGGAPDDLDLRDAFSVYATGALGLKPEDDGKERTTFIGCNGIIETLKSKD